MSEEQAEMPEEGQITEEEAQAVEAEVLGAGEQDAEPGPERRRYVQFLFDEKMMEFEVDWTSAQLTDMVTEVNKDDGFFWIPRDEELDTGTFVNLANCTGVTLVEREEPKPLSFGTEPEVGYQEDASDVYVPTPEEEAARQEEMARACAARLDQLAAERGLPKRCSFREKGADAFWTAIIASSFPELEDPDQVYMAWIGGAYSE